MKRRDGKKRVGILFGVLAGLFCLSLQPAFAGRVLFTNFSANDSYAVQVSVALPGQVRDHNTCSPPRDQQDIALGKGAITKIIVVKPSRTCLEGDFSPVQGAVLKEYTVSGDPAANRIFLVTVKADGIVLIDEKK